MHSVIAYPKIDIGSGWGFDSASGILIQNKERFFHLSPLLKPTNDSRPFCLNNNKGQPARRQDFFIGCYTPHQSDRHAYRTVWNCIINYFEKDIAIISLEIGVQLIWMMFKIA